MVEHHLRAAENVAGREQPQAHAGDVADLAVRHRFERAARALAEAQAHDGDGLGRSQHVRVAGPRVVAVAVRHDGTLDRARRIDEEAAWHAIKPARRHFEPVEVHAALHKLASFRRIADVASPACTPTTYSM